MNKVSITTDEFKRRATQMHKGVYDYSTTVYISYLKKVEIGCRKDDHGRFWQKAGDHLIGKGCPKCARSLGGLAVKLSNEDFIRRVEKVKGKGTFDYPRAIYTGIFDPIIVTCKKHGDFTTTPNCIFSPKRGNCPTCRTEKREGEGEGIEFKGKKFSSSRIERRT
jgi:hypothetical protein